MPGRHGFERRRAQPRPTSRDRMARVGLLAVALIPLVLLASGCLEPRGETQDAIVFELEPRALATGRHRDPQLAVRASGAIALALVAPGERGIADLDLYLSHSGGDVFEKRLRINRESGSVQSHPEGSPVFVMGPRSRFHAFWLSNVGRGTRALRTSLSKDFLNSFEAPITVTTGKHGTPAFFSAAVSAKGELLAAWLGQRPDAETLPGTAHLLVSRSQDGGEEFSTPIAVAPNVCPCCRPALVAGDDGHWIVAWRDTDAQNVRRIQIASSEDAGRRWTKWPAIPGPGWQIDGCPHSGPAIALHEGTLHVAWYSEAEGRPTLLSTSRPLGGGQFSALRRLAADVTDANHPSLASVGERLFVAFQGRPPDDRGGWGNTEIYLQELGAEAEGPIVRVPRGAGTASYPVISDLHAGRMLVAWTETDEQSSRVMGVRGRLASP